ncbi:MAG: nucleoside-diphosphate kinase [Planctomycetota bacterium]
METSLVLVKPDGVQRGLVGRVLSRFEDKGLSIAGLKLLVAPKATLEKHYAVHRERPFYGSLLQFMGSGPVVAIAVRGVNAVAVVRTLLGPTNGQEAPGGTIRGDFGMSRSFNLVHASDSTENAAMELGLWFPEGTCDYQHDVLRWVYDDEA